MKKTQQKDAVRNIKKRIVSYLSIMLVVGLGLGGLFTTRYTGAGLDRQATGYFEAHNFKDFDFASSYGISEANLEKIRSADKVTDAEGVIQADGSASFGGRKMNVTIISLTERISVPDIAEGRLPSGRDECIIGEDFAEMEGLKVGDRVTLSLTGLTAFKDQFSSDADMDMDMNMDMSTGAEGGQSTENAGQEDEEEEKHESPLYSKQFTVTGLMHHPDFLRRKAVNTVTLPLSAFDPEATEGLYTRAFVTIEQPEKTGMFSEKYFERTKSTRESLEALAEELEEDRTKEVKDKAYADIDREWAKAEAKLADAQNEIDEGEAELNEKLAEGSKKLNDAQALLDREVAKYEKLLSDGKKTLAEKEKELNKGKKEFEKKKKEFEEAKKKLEEGRKALAEKEKELEQAKKTFEKVKAVVDHIRAKLGGDGNIRKLGDLAKDARARVDVIDGLIAAGEEEKATEEIRNLGQLIKDNGELIKSFFDLAADPETKKLLETLQEYVEIDIVKAIEELNETGYDRFMEYVDRLTGEGALEAYKENRTVIVKTLDTIITLTDGYWTVLDKIAEVEKLIADGENKIKEGKKEIAKYEKLIAKGEKTIAKYEKLIAKGEKLLKEKKKELRDGEAKFAEKKAEGQNKIRAGWAQYYEEKAKYEKKLAEAVELLETNREKAEKKLAEAKAEVGNIAPCDWIVLDRKGNAGFVDIMYNLDAVARMGVVFGFLFAVITAIVCFSTLVIIIDEQKTLVGTSKAFGFFKREILGKYLVFGVSSSIIGSILAIIGAYFLSELIQVKYETSGMYPIGVAKSVITPVPTVLFSLLIIAVTVAATVFACTDILRSPASMLMNGAVLKKEKKNKKEKKTVSNKGSLYSRLIIRNMIEDKARVMVTIAIIAFSCMLIGLGISMKLAYDGMMNRQESSVHRFDIRMDMNEDVTDDEEAELVRVLEKNNTSFMPATVSAALYKWDNKLDGMSLICANPERIGEFYGIVDPKTGRDMTLPEDGILIQKRMHESYGMDVGEALPVLDSSLREHDAEIKGTFVNYVGRTVMLSPAAYKSIFGEVNEANCYFVKLNGADASKVEKELLAASDNISFVAKDEFKTKFESASRLYTILVLITTGIAILISFMILTNLANIYLNHKKKELTVMRINGFTIREARGYLSKESILTTAAGLALGVLAGAIVTPMIIKSMQQPDLEFIKSFQIIAWASAVGLEALFAVIINSMVYRKVKYLSLRDIE